MAATGAASDVAGSTLTTTPTITSAIANGPVLNFIDKRRRALRKKCKRIIQMEESVSKGKILNKEQQEVLRYKISISHSIDELEKLRAPLATLVADEISLAIKSNQIKTSEFCTHPPANMRPDDMASVATGGNVGSADAPSLAPLNGSVVSDLQMDESVGQHQKMIEDSSRSQVMGWVNYQLKRIIEGAHIAIRKESWDPVSPQEQHGSSIVEVYNLAVEIIDQVLAFRVPMDFQSLSILFCGIDFAFLGYAKRVAGDLDIKDLVLDVPFIIRYKKESWIKAFVKKFLDRGVPKERKSNDISVLPTQILCVQLNTLHYAVNLLNKLEDSISERWSMKRASEKFLKGQVDEKARRFSQENKFDNSRKDLSAAIDRICEYTGFKIIFGDLREPVIENLYIPSVSQSRLDTVIKPLEAVALSHVLLDGGPSRVFSPADAKYIDDDLDVLKEFFIVGGRGLPREVVENRVTRVQEIIRLHNYEVGKFVWLWSIPL